MFTCTYDAMTLVRNMKTAISGSQWIPPLQQDGAEADGTISELLSVVLLANV